MATLREELLNTLLDLKEDQFKHFKFYLKDDGILGGLSRIREAKLEKADRMDMVDLMVQKYQDRQARNITLKVLEKIDRNDLVKQLQNFIPSPKAIRTFCVGAQKKARPLKWVQQFAVDVTLDPKTAHPNLILSDDGKKVHHGDIRKKLPSNPERFYRCVNVLGKQSFSLGRSYFEVQVEGKIAWDLGVAKESIKRKGGITTNPENGYWTLILRDGDEYGAFDEDLVGLSLKQQPCKIGVFVDYEEGLVSFYDADSADHLYSYTNCVFNEKLLPFLSPCTNQDGANSAPLILSPVNYNKEYERKKAELKSVQQFAVDVTLDPDTAHPALILSDDGKQVYCGDECQKVPDSRMRFNRCVNVLGKQSFSSGKSYFEVQVEGKTAWDLGVAKESIKRKGSITTRPKDGYWTIMLRNGDEYEALDEDLVSLSPKQHLRKIGVFVDYDQGQVSFYNVDSAALLYSFTRCSFTEKLYPFLSPCADDDGVNSAPLILSSVNQDDDYERKKAELKSVQQFAVDVTLDPDTAHPALILSDDGKQVYCGDECQKVPDSRMRFNKCVNVLGKQSFSSGKSYFEVQVEGKTAWDLGVAKESINRRGKITIRPKDGYWTIVLRNGDEYKALGENLVSLSPKQHLRKIGVFVDYDQGQVSFYNVDSAALLYSFTRCSFTEKLYPFLSPCADDDGVNSAPLILSSVNQDDDYERKKAELKSVQQFAVDVTLDPDTAHPALILSDDGKQVYCGDECQKVPDSSMRFNKCVNVLGKQSFSSGKSYFEVQVEGKNAWTLGVAKESINRRGKITLSPENGFLTIWLRNGDKYTANNEHPVRLSLNQHPRKVGVFVDYDKGQVSFYDADAANILYMFTDCSFEREKLFPYLSPCSDDDGKNSAPLIICPVNHND